MSHFNLFVYGRLAGDGASADAGSVGPLDGCVRASNARVGGVLYDIDGRFPALLLYGAAPVTGEVWRCPVDALARLDAHQGVSDGLFRRVGVEVETEGGDRVACWVYTAGPAISRSMVQERRLPQRS